MNRSTTALALAAAGILAGAQAASAHVGFLKRQVPLAATMTMTLRVPHGCNGSPTVRLRMRVPKAVTAIRPEAKPGWTVATSGEGASREVAWSGSLPAKQAGEFSFAVDLDKAVKPGEVIFFPVVQECEKGVSRWIDIQGRPSADAPESEEHDESTSPAPSIRLLPRQ
jgi:uncharacterized protein YcnI